MSSIASIFVGVPQSHLAGTAILLVIIALSIFILFGKEQISVGEKVGIVLVMLLMALPTILLTLFQLNCVVTGAGSKGQRWWCDAYAWLVAVLIVVYCVLLVVAAVLSFSKSQSILSEENFTVRKHHANAAAREHFANVSGGDAAAPRAGRAASADIAGIASIARGGSAAPEGFEGEDAPMPASMPAARRNPAASQAAAAAPAGAPPAFEGHMNAPAASAASITAAKAASATSRRPPLVAPPIIFCAECSLRPVATASQCAWAMAASTCDCPRSARTRLCARTVHASRSARVRTSSPRGSAASTAGK
jgi:hypothetical protein